MTILVPPDTTAPTPPPNGKVPAPEPKTAPAPPAAPAAPVKDVRYIALRNFAISMTIFNILGYAVLGFEQPWLWPLAALATGYATELLLETITAQVQGREPGYRGNGFRGFWTFLLPAHITALAVNLLLYTNNRFWPVLFGVVVAVSAKYILQAPIKGRMKHYMNPSNFGITVVLLAFPWVNMVPPYHFTENVSGTFKLFIPMLILTSGTVLNAVLTKKVMLIMGWVGAFVIQALVRWALFDVAVLSALAVMTGVAFVLFTNYMITDPGTSPMGSRPQFIFGASVGAVYGVLMAFNIVYTLFFAVCIVCLVRGMGWWIVSGLASLRARKQARAELLTSPVSTEPEAVPA
jgi:enediyne biosynthesis protein E5